MSISRTIIQSDAHQGLIIENMKIYLSEEMKGFLSANKKALDHETDYAYIKLLKKKQLLVEAIYQKICGLTTTNNSFNRLEKLFIYLCSVTDESFAVEYNPINELATPEIRSSTFFPPLEEWSQSRLSTATTNELIIAAHRWKKKMYGYQLNTLYTKPRGEKLSAEEYVAKGFATAFPKEHADLSSRVIIISFEDLYSFIRMLFVAKRNQLFTYEIVKEIVLLYSGTLKINTSYLSKGLRFFKEKQNNNEDHYRPIIPYEEMKAIRLSNQEVIKKEKDTVYASLLETKILLMDAIYFTLTFLIYRPDKPLINSLTHLFEYIQTTTHESFSIADPLFEIVSSFPEELKKLVSSFKTKMDEYQLSKRPELESRIIQAVQEAGAPHIIEKLSVPIKNEQFILIHSLDKMISLAKEKRVFCAETIELIISLYTHFSFTEQRRRVNEKPIIALLDFLADRSKIKKSLESKESYQPFPLEKLISITLDTIHREDFNDMLALMLMVEDSIKTGLPKDTVEKAIAFFSFNESEPENYCRLAYQTVSLLSLEKASADKKPTGYNKLLSLLEAYSESRESAEYLAEALKNMHRFDLMTMDNIVFLKTVSKEIYTYTSSSDASVLWLIAHNPKLTQLTLSNLQTELRHKKETFIRLAWEHHREDGQESEPRDSLQAKKRK